MGTKKSRARIAADFGGRRLGQRIRRAAGKLRRHGINALPECGPSALPCTQRHQPANQRNSTACEPGGHYLATYWWKIGRAKGIFVHGRVVFACMSGETLENELLHDPNDACRVFITSARVTDKVS